MNTAVKSACAVVAFCGVAAACATAQAPIPVDSGSAAPGGFIQARGTPVRLLGTPIAVGAPLPATALIDADTLRPVDLAGERGKVLFISVVVSLDTAA